VQALSEIPKYGRKWAVLGDMLELGKYTEAEHNKIGQQVMRQGIDYLVCVGPRSLDIIYGAKEAGMSEDKIFHFDNSDFLQGKIQTDDILLIKGSQGVRMEKITKSLMAEPLRAKDLLVRQSDLWLK
jgi:UDP-N-acetylmuramoyl-tripeptide--D-alanyl-D-alanine ligase